MRPISKTDRKTSSLGLTGVLPDQDNPLAWKRKAREGRRGARDLLWALTDDEVARYMAVAGDQARIEERFAVPKLLCVLIGLALFAAATRHGFLSGFGGWDIAGLGLGFAMGYWPWRVFKCRQLWLEHVEAARAELARRRDYPSPGMGESTRKGG